MADNLTRVRETYYLALPMTEAGLFQNVGKHSRLSALKLAEVAYFWSDVERWSGERIPEKTRRNLTTVGMVAEYLDKQA